VRAKGERNEVGREERERRDAHKGEHMRKTVTLEYRPGTCTDSGAAEKTRAGQYAVYLVVVPSGVGKGAGGRKAQREGGVGEGGEQFKFEEYSTLFKKVLAMDLLL
jgi:hypothetical protein